MSIAKWTNGRRGASGKHAGYITRESACDSISFHNLDNLQGENQFESKTNAISYAYAREDIEEKGRTHYRLMLSWDRKEETDRAREQAHEYLQENFKDSRAIVAVHQDTEHTHAHVWVDARQTDERKLHISKRDFENIRDNWTRQYDREYNTEFEKNYQAKYAESREWKRERTTNSEREGKQPRPTDKPERANDRLNNASFREKDTRDKGVERIDESRARGSQRPIAVRDSNVEEAERAITGSQQQLGRSEQDVNRATEQAHQTESATRNLRQEFERVAEKSSKVKDRDRRDVER